MLKDQISTDEQLLEKCNYATLHIRRLRIISTKVFKSLNNLNLIFMKEMFNVKETSYNLRDSSLMYLPSFNKIMYGKTHLNIMVPICGIFYLMILSNVWI